LVLIDYIDEGFLYYKWGQVMIIDFVPAAITAGLDQRFKAFPFLHKITRMSEELLAGYLDSVDIPAASLLLQEGDDCQMLLLVESGDIRVYRQAENGRTITFYHVSPGESCVLGINCLLREQDYPAQAVTDSPCRALTIPAAIFRQLFRDDPACQEFVMDLFSRRMSSLMLLVGEITFGQMEQRLARFIFETAEKHPGEFHPITLSHEQIALQLGTAREVVSRLLQQFSEEGLIKLERLRISLLKPKEIENIYKSHQM